MTATLICEDCGEIVDGKRRTRCDNCGLLLCRWCYHHCHKVALQAGDDGCGLRAHNLKEHPKGLNRDDSQE